jgi:hypothetical protein
MGWLTLLKALLGLAKFVAHQIERRQLIKRGESRILLKSLEASHARIQRAADIRRKVSNAPLDADDDGVPDDDGFRRD